MNYQDFKKEMFKHITTLSNNKYNCTILYLQIIKKIEYICTFIIFDNFVSEMDKYSKHLNSKIGGLFLKILIDNGFKNVTSFLQNILKYNI